jgi:hypothetical protein
MSTATSERVFKTPWFSKAVQKAGITDDELCDAIHQVKKGQADDLGGGVFKKRLNKNEHRRIILAKSRKYWVYTFLFAKKDRSNIRKDELLVFREFADLIAKKTDKEIEKDLSAKELLEICNEDKAKL